MQFFLGIILQAPFVETRNDQVEITYADLKKHGVGHDHPMPFGQRSITLGILHCIPLNLLKSAKQLFVMHVKNVFLSVKLCKVCSVLQNWSSAQGGMPIGPNGSDALLFSQKKHICHGYLYAVHFILHSQNCMCSRTAVSKIRLSPFPTSCIRSGVIWAVNNASTGQWSVDEGKVIRWCHNAVL